MSMIMKRREEAKLLIEQPYPLDMGDDAKPAPKGKPAPKAKPKR